MAHIIFLIIPFISTIAFASKQGLYPFESIYQFGDSLSDTGNRIRQIGVSSTCNISSWPYGMTYFHKPTGRFSDGLLVVDFVAMALNLPLLNPYLERNASFDHGVNFAVAGSTALDNAFFAKRNIVLQLTNVPLSKQMAWFSDHLKSVTNDASEREKMLQDALVIMGEFGGDDLLDALQVGWSLEDIRMDFMPFVVDSIANAVREAVRLGATYIVVPGMLPQGCFPNILTNYPSTDHRDYDDKGCLIPYNEVVLFFNSRLQTALEYLKVEFPQVSILYFDYYDAFQSLLHDAAHFGFDTNLLLKACCGNGGNYNYHKGVACGSKKAKLCHNPADHIHWDGWHLTQEAYRHISDRFIQDVLPKSYAM